MQGHRQSKLIALASLAFVFAFAYGLLLASFVPEDAHTKIYALMDNNVFLIVIVGAVVSAVSMYMLVRVSRGNPTILLLLVKLYVLCLPFFAGGVLVRVLLGLFGVVETKHIGFLCVVAMANLCGGIGGIVAMRRDPAQGVGE